jgi:DNA-binding response OmpR family regulator
MHSTRSGPSHVDVLVIDDDELWGMALLDRLRGSPWRAAFHHGPFGTVNAIRAAQPRVLILDLNMPGLEGTRILELMRKRKELMQTKVLLLSSTEPQELDRIAIESGFDAALHKSASKADLMSTITALMGRTLA